MAKTAQSSTSFRTRRTRAVRIQVNATSVGGRNHYWIAKCPKHGNQQHLSYLNGACVKCQDEGLIAQGLIKP